jgi:cytochrome bd-type quinol oxidase subunit 1
LLLIIAVANGALRETFLTPSFGQRAAHVISTIMLCAAIFIVAWFSIRWIGPKNAGAALAIGITWLLLTIAFEFLAGHYLFGNTWENLMADYKLLKGRIWILVLLSDLLAPLWAFSLLRA